MKLHSGLKPGAMLILLIATLLFAGCTQPVTVATSTPTPTATTAPPTAIPTVIEENQTLKAELAALAEAFAEGVDGKALATAMKEGPNSTAFATVLGQLKAFKATDPRIIYLYTLEQKDGRVRFIVDADYGLPEGSDYLEEYPDAAEELKTPVTSPIGVGPYTDQWGTFFSGYAPVDTGSNVSILLLGVDIQV